MLCLFREENELIFKKLGGKRRRGPGFERENALVADCKQSRAKFLPIVLSAIRRHVIIMARVAIMHVK